MNLPVGLLVTVLQTRRIRPWRLIRGAIVVYITLMATGFLPASLSPAPQVMAQSTDIWLMIDTNELTLGVMQGSRILARYKNIAIGSNGTTREKRVKDEKTPLGDFRITGIRPSKRFQLFLAIDYPNMDHVERALAGGRITTKEYQALLGALSKGKPPPQGTSLGGNLGIHGIGAGSLQIHNNVNWTDGCIALTNEQVQKLAGWVSVGTRVRIR
ncbi:MAG: L,D-transpeptidase [Halioglobus sp.]